MRPIELIWKPGSDLIIKVADWEEFEEVVLNHFEDEHGILFHLLEYGGTTGYIGNGYSCGHILGLTDAPNIAYMDSIDDNGNLIDAECIWYYSTYMIDSFIEKLSNKGEVVFSLLK